MNGSQRLPGRDLRGNSYGRRRRRLYLWTKCRGDIFGFISCHHCGAKLYQDQFEVDRFPVCGHDGGRYVRSNIVPSCQRCNATRCTEFCRGYGH